MPTWKDKLTDQQIAAVATFIRNNWGNKAEAVTAAMVAKNRQKVKGLAGSKTRTMKTGRYGESAIPACLFRR